MSESEPTFNVLVTGASSGIGLATARLLAGRGWRVFGGVRKKEDAEAIAGANIQPVMMDITDVESVAAAAGVIDAAVGDRGLRGLVNNAGLMVGGPMEFVPIADLRRILEVNVIGQVAVTQAMLPMLRRARGRIVNISSISGRMALPMFGPYNASKFAIEALSDALRMELAGSGVKVIVIEPGPVRSRIWEKSREQFERMFGSMPARAKEVYGGLIDAVKRVANESEAGAIPAEDLAGLIYRAMTTARPATRYPIGRLAKTRDFAARVIPDKWRDWMILRILKMRSRKNA
ncbi:SDR family oxidoreductase [bacterium]|nr:SDR family oxidoreductase [bacterium]